MPHSTLPNNVLLPSSSDHLAMVNNFGTLVSRILVEESSYFSVTFEGVVTKHIPHCHSDEMGKKSETVKSIIILFIIIHTIHAGPTWYNYEE